MNCKVAIEMIINFAISFYDSTIPDIHPQKWLNVLQFQIHIRKSDWMFQSEHYDKIKCDQYLEINPQKKNYCAGELGPEK